MRYLIAPSNVGQWLVLDTLRNCEVVAAGLSEADARAWASRLNLRHAWGG